MKKKLLSILTLLLCLCTGAWADETTLFELGSNGEFPTDISGIAYTSNVSVGQSVKINTNTNTVYGIKFGSSYKIENGTPTNYLSLTPDEGFKAGDVITIAGAFNNADDTKSAQIAIYAADGNTQLFITKNFVNGRTSADNPTEQQFTLETAQEKLYLGRSGNTGTFITTLKVVRQTAATNTAPTISIEASSTSAKVGNEVTLTATTTGYPSPTINWYACSDEEGTISGESLGTEATYSPSTTIAGTYYYKAVATNNFNDADHVAASNVITLIVTEPVEGEYDNETTTITWSMNNGTSSTSVVAPEDAALSTAWSTGSNMSVFSTRPTSSYNGYTYTEFFPSVKVTKSRTAGHYVDFTYTPKNGLTFTPTGVSFVAYKIGTGGGNVDVDFIDGEGNTIQLATGEAVVRNNNSTDDPTKTYELTTAAESTGAVTLRVWIFNIDAGNSKTMGICNVVISGTVSGNPIDVTTYTITAAANDATLGSVAGGNIYEENAEATLTATANTGAQFANWTKASDTSWSSTENPLTVTATADETYTANFEKLMAVSFSATGATGSLPATVYVESGNSYTIPVLYFFYKEGYSLIGWSDGTTTYAPGATINDITSDMALTAVFSDATQLGDAETTVNWTFATENSAPAIAFQYTEEDYYVQHTTINEGLFDAVMKVNTKANAVITDATGKLNNASKTNCAQANKGTMYTIPAIDGMVVTYTYCNGTPTVESLGFADAVTLPDPTNLDNADAVDTSAKTITYTYNGSGSVLYIIETVGNMYPAGISVSYPKIIPVPAAATNVSATLTYTGGSVSGKVWTGSDDCNGYTITADESGSIGVKNDTKFAFGVDGTYTIAVPENMTVTSFKIVGAANSSTSTVTYNEESNDYGNSSDSEHTWTVASPSAGGSISFSVATKPFNVTSITLYTDDITLTTTDNMAGWRAFYDASQGYTVDEGTKVFVAPNGPVDNVVTFTKIDAIPAGTAVVLYHEDKTDSHKMTLTKAEVDSYGGVNLLKWTTSAVENKYRLGYGASGVGFYPYSGTPASGAVYLDVSSVSEARALTFAFDEGTTTGISSTRNDMTNDNVVYDLQGRKINGQWSSQRHTLKERMVNGQLPKGLYIVNGKKVVVK